MNYKKIIKEFLKKKTVIISLAILCIIVLACIAAPILAENDIYLQNLPNKLSGPTSKYPMGTDELGRCIFSRILYGGRATLGYAAVSTTIAAIIGTMIGMFSAYMGGKVDNLIMRFCDIMYAFPSLILTLVIVAVLGSGLNNILIAMLITQWLYYARMSRSMTLAEKCHDYIASARINGDSTFQIITKHIFPNILPQMIAIMTIDFGHTILTISGLSFLGLGVQPPAPEWGYMINAGRSYIYNNPMMMLWPGLCILLVVITVNIIGDNLRDVLDEINN